MLPTSHAVQKAWSYNSRTMHACIATTGGSKSVLLDTYPSWGLALAIFTGRRDTIFSCGRWSTKSMCDVLWMNNPPYKWLFICRHKQCSLLGWMTGKRHSYTQTKPRNPAKTKTATRCSNEDRLDCVSSRLVWKVSLGGDSHPCMHHAVEQNNHAT
jgi:hypothetical protein